MHEKIYTTSKGSIHYWVNSYAHLQSVQLVFLPGLTADHHLFDKQIEHFEGKYPVLVWDAPCHASSYPFDFDFSLFDKARWLDEIITTEGFDRPLIIGQSMGGYVGQVYSELFPGKLAGFISIDSAPLQREYMTAPEIWLLKIMSPVYKIYPWKALIRDCCNNVATSDYGRQLMRDTMSIYDGDKERYVSIAGGGYKMLAEACERNLPYKLPEHSLLICGDKDSAGSTRRYNREWNKRAGIPIEWIEGAGHNSNTDAPDKVNDIIEEFVRGL